MADSGASSADPAPSVVVFGATVAGLTAAHELARRGFAVSVIVAKGEVPGGATSAGWMPRRRIVPFADRGKLFPSASPVPAEIAVDPFPASARHLLATLSSIPSPSSSPSRSRSPKSSKPIADDMVEQPWQPARRLGAPLPIYPNEPPRDAAGIVDGAKAFVTTGYTPQDGHTFVARTLRFLTSSTRRRRAECETVSMLDYLRGANAAAVPASCEYSPAFLADVADAPDPTGGARAFLTDARTGIGAYVQSLVTQPGPTKARHSRFPTGTRVGWFEPWLAHLRDDLDVKFLAGRLARLTAPSIKRGERATVGARVTECGRSTQRLIARATYLIVATDAADAESACTGLPSVGVAGALRGFTERRRPRGARPAPSDPRSERRWEKTGGIQLFLPEHLTLEGPLAVVGSPWRLVVRPQPTFSPRSPVAARDRYGSVVAVDIGGWDERAPRIRKAALDCGERELAREVWAQISDAQTLHRRGRPPRPPSWFAVDSRVELSGRGRVGATTPRLFCLPGDWSNRPGPDPYEARSAAGRGGQDPVWGDPEGNGWVHWKRLVFAGDYLKTFTRTAGPEAACESGRRAANTILAHARGRRAAAAVDVPPRALLFAPEANELTALADLKKLDDWCAREGLPHPFALAGLDGWISLVSWFGVLYPVSEPFMKTVVDKLVGMARTADRAEATNYQEGVLEALRKLRDGLQREFHRPPA